jgi:hypothetical protein
MPTSQLRTTSSSGWPSRRSNSTLAIEPLDDTNFEEIARRAYRNAARLDEFGDDLKLIRYIKRLLNLYRETGELRCQLILNHLTVFLNVFTPDDIAVKLLVFRMMRQLDLLKPFLVYLQRWPERIDNLGIAHEGIWGSDIPMDAGAVEQLRRHQERMRRGGEW